MGLDKHQKHSAKRIADYLNQRNPDGEFTFAMGDVQRLIQETVPRLDVKQSAIGPKTKALLASGCDHTADVSSTPIYLGLRQLVREIVVDGESDRKNDAQTFLAGPVNERKRKSSWGVKSGLLCQATISQAAKKFVDPDPGQQWW